MTCNFYVNLNGKIVLFTEDELVSFLIANGFTSTNKSYNLENRIKYSLSEAQDIADRLKEESNEHKIKVTSVVDGDPEYEGIITPQNLIDSDIFYLVGFPHIPQKNDENYIENMAKLLLSDEIDIEEAKKMAIEEINHWDVIADDSALLHRFLPIALANLKNEEEFRRVLKSDDFYPLYKKLQGTVLMPDGTTKTKIDLLIDSLKDAETTIGYILGGVDKSNSSSVVNVSLDVDLPKLNKTLGVHVDKIYIDQNGELYVINYKFSSTPYDLWSRVKKEKYKYKMAIIKRVLLAKGYNVRGMKMYDIPMYVEYDGNDIKAIRRDPRQESINYVIENNKASLVKYENFVKTLIDVPVTITKPMTEVDLLLANNILLTVLPKTGVRAEGIEMTAEQWILTHNGICIRLNTELNSDIYYYVDLQDGNPPIPITEKSIPTKNKQILDLVKSHADLFENGSDIVMNHLIKSIRNNYENHTCIFENGSGFKFNSTYLTQVMKPYLEYEERDGKKFSTWEMIETPELHQCGIILFRNNTTHQLDMVIASPHNVNAQMRLTDGNTNLLGMHIYDMNAGHMIKGDYGNIEIIKGMTVLNQIIPSIQGEYNLGSIKVITPKISGSGRIRTFLQMLPHFGKVLQFANSKMKLKTDNNLMKQQVTNPIDVILDNYRKILELDNLSSLEKQKDTDLGFLGLQNVKTTSEKIEALKVLIDNIYKRLGEPSINYILNLANNSSNKEINILANVYLEAIQTINYLYGNNEFVFEKIHTAYRYVMPQYANPDLNVRMVADIYSKALDNTAIEFGKVYKPIRHIVEDFLENSGYGSASKALLGNSVKLYDNMFELDVKGNKTMRFKDPYNDSTMSSTEREFLKKILFEIAKVRARRKGESFSFSGINDRRLLSYIEEHRSEYFLVPLKRKSSKTKSSKPVQEIQSKIGRFKRRVKGLVENFSDYTKNWIQEELEKFEYSLDIDIPFESMSVRNPYAMSEDPTLRATMINRFGTDYFDTDVELLVADYVEKLIVTEKMLEVQFKCKAILTEMHFLGSIEGNEQLIQQSIKEIEDFLKVNMFGQSIMEDFSKKAMLAIMPLKSMVSKVYIAANIRSAFRDTFEGVWLNIARTINNYLTDIDSKSLLEGYKKVIKQIPESSKGIGIMSGLCLRYRLSNTDEAKISEKATNRGGIYDVDSWAYSTLRGPDFLNRMVLFTARCVKDGVWDAFSINKDGDLVYNWKQDKRFYLFASGNKSHPDYVKQKGLYLSLIQQYNRDHPEANLSYDDDLPEPYTQNEIKAIKLLSNSIYGAYDKSLKAKLENIALGQTFCMFSTWLNGITANYLKKPGEYAEHTEMLHKKDDAGNLLYFDLKHNIIVKKGDKYYDEENNEVFPEEALPVYEQVPVMVQGILYTLGRSAKMICSLNDLKEGIYKFKKEIWSNKHERQNINKFLSDLIALLLFNIIFGVVLKEGYEEFKKDKKKNDALTNGFVELLYSSSSRSYDGFKGIFAITDYALNDVEPMAVNANISLLKDLGKTLLGDMQFDTLLYKDVPVFRAFKQTYTKLSKS